MANIAETETYKREYRDATPIDAGVLKVVKDAENEIRGDEAIWQEALAFFNNDQYVFVNAVDNSLDRLETREGGTKPRHRMRLTRNRLTMQTVAKVAYLCQRIPSYEVGSPNQDPQRINQARLAEQALADQHEKLALEMCAIETLIYSVSTGAGFSWPYWSPYDGAWLGEYEGEPLQEGAIKLWRLHQGEVLWQSGLDFEDSPWICVRKAQPCSYVTSRPGYTGPSKLPADARAGLWERPGATKGDLVFVYHFIEKPSKEHSEGRWLTFAAGQEIRKAEAYPREEGRPCIHQLPWIPQPSKHRALGAGPMMVDIQRTWNRTLNQIIAWKNLVLLPQMKAPVGSLQTDPTDEYGVVWEYRPVAGKEPEWREVPEIPLSLFKMLDLCLSDFEHVLSMDQVPPGVESGSGAEQYRGMNAEAQSMFTKGLARFYASQGYHLVELIAKHYTEPMLLEVQGRYAVDRIPDFTGTKLGSPGHLRVTVPVSSIEPRSRAAMEGRLMGYAERGWLEPHQVMAAINGGVAAQLIDDFELDIARQHREIEQLLALGGWKPDPYLERAVQMTQLAPGGDVGMMPPSLQAMLPSLPNAEDYDNHVVHIDVLQQWMKTTEFEQQPELVKQGARNHRSQHEMLQDQAAAKLMMRQMGRAQMLGQGNAGRDVGIKAAPSPASQETLAGKAQQPAGE